MQKIKKYCCRIGCSKKGMFINGKLLYCKQHYNEIIDSKNGDV